MNEDEIIKYYFENKNIKQICYYKNGKLHNLEGPARIDLLDKVSIKYWFQDGLFHNDHNCAMETIFDDGRFIREWYNEGKLHRLGGSVLSNNESYYIYGKKYDKYSYWRVMSNLKKFIRVLRRRVQQRRIKDFLTQEAHIYNYISSGISGYF